MSRNSNCSVCAQKGCKTDLIVEPELDIEEDYEHDNEDERDMRMNHVNVI